MFIHTLSRRTGPSWRLGMVLGYLAFSLPVSGQTLARVVPARQVMKNYGKLPLSFEATRGRADPQVKFLARGAGFSLFLTGNNAILMFSRRQIPQHSSEASGLGPTFSADGGSDDAADKPKERMISSAKRDVVRMELAGARADVEPTGEGLLPGTANYFTGSDPANWHTAIPTYSKVDYRGIYPGVDLVYYGNHQQLEYDLIVAPNADPSQIRLRFDGTAPLALDDAGNLSLGTERGSALLHRPVVYQTQDGQRQPVDGSFVIVDNNYVRFRVGDYDHTRPLVIDPILSYSTFLDGANDLSVATSIAVDAAGEAFITGYCGTEFPTTVDAFQTTRPPGGYSIFVTKLSADGSSLLYSTYLDGGSGMDDGPSEVSTGITIDGAGDAYVAGYTPFTGFPVTPGAYQPKNPVVPNPESTEAVASGFVTEINSTGTGLVYSTYLGGSDLTQLKAIAVDSAGHAYVTGFTLATDYPVTAGAFQRSVESADTAGTTFVTEVNANGSGLEYSTYLGGNGKSNGYAVSVDAAGEATVGGFTQATDFPITPNAVEQVSALPGQSSFVTKVNSTGSELVYSTYLDGSEGDLISGLVVDAPGNAYVTGVTHSTNFPVTAGAFQTTLKSSGGNVFVSKIIPDGTAFSYSTYVGGSTTDVGFAVAIDALGDAFITGTTASDDYPITASAFETAPYAYDLSGELSGFLTEINPTGSALKYSTFLGGSGSGTGDLCDCPSAIAVDRAGNPYITGSTGSEDFPTTLGVFMPVLEADEGFPPYVIEATSAFVAKFDQSEMKILPPTTTVVRSSADPQIPGTDVILTARVTAQAGGAIPTGIVSFDFDNYLWFSAALDSTGTATYTIPSTELSVGSNYGFATYLGDSSNAPSNAVFTQDIVWYNSSISITASPASPIVGTPVTFTMTVTGTPASPVPTGTVQLSDTAYAPFGTISAPLDGNGVATITTSALPPTVNSVFVEYLPNDNLHAKSTNALAVTILPTIAPANPVFSPPPGIYSSPQNVTMTDSTTAAEICYTTDGTTPSKLCNLPSPSTSQYLSPIPIGQTTTLEAVAASANYLQSSVVTGIYIITSLAMVKVSPSAANITTAQSLNVAVSVSGPSGDTVPSGSVILTSGTFAASPVHLTGGTATISIPTGFLPVGTDTLTVSYTPDYFSSFTYNITTGSGSVIVTPPPTPGITVSSTAVTVKAGATTGNTSTITVTPSGGLTGEITLSAVVTTSPGNSFPPTFDFGTSSPVIITNTSPGTATLTISTTAASSQCTTYNEQQQGKPWSLVGGTALSCVVLFLMPLQRRRLRIILGLLALLSLSGGLLACGSSSAPVCTNFPISGTSTGTYTVTVTGIGGGAVGTTVFTLMVD